MDTRNKTRLIRAALAARKQAKAHHSKFKVGAALLTKSGEIIVGSNVESDSYGLTCCAERTAIFEAVTNKNQKKSDLIAVAVVAQAELPSPCGACRQLLWEYAPNAAVYVVNSKKPKMIREFTVRELLPHPFVLKPKARRKKRTR